jgi:hypothetical protein
MFDLDRPIENSRDDKLGLLPFASGLARSIANQRIGDGLVIAINGAWGSGKTSAVNIALEELSRIEEIDQKKQKTSTTVVYKFDPWLHTGQENLIVEFFAGLAESLDRTMGYEVAKAVRDIAGGLLQRSSALFGVAAIGVDAAGGSGAATAALTVGKELSKKLPASWGKDSLASQKKRLKEVLFRQMRKVLVVIDDIDRLQPEEMKLMLGVLKSIADLPGVIYLLPMDVRLVTVITDKDRNGQGGYSYIEKIVQVSLELPRPSRDGMSRYFSEGLTSLIGDDEEAKYEISDWDYIAGNVLRTYLKTPRSVVRLLNGLRVSWPAAREEAYFPDMLGVEALREFEPAAYAYIRDNGNTLINLTSREKDAREQIKEELSSRMRPETRSGSLSLCGLLFPGIGYGSTRAISFDPLAARRIWDEDGFDAYFRWSLPDDVATIKELRSIQRALDQGDDVSSLIKRISERSGTNGNRASRKVLEAIIDGKIVEHPFGTRLTESLLEHAETIVDIPPDADWLMSSNSMLTEAVETLISRIPFRSRVPTLKELLANPALSLYGGAKLLHAISDKGIDAVSIVSKQQRVKLTSAWFTEQLEPRIHELRASRHADLAVHVVKKVMGPATAKKLIDANIDAPVFAASVALGLMSNVNSSAQSRIYKDLNRTPDPDVYDIPALLEAVNRIDLTAFNERDRDGLTTFRSKVKLIAEKKFVPE